MRRGLRSEVAGLSKHLKGLLLAAVLGCVERSQPAQLEPPPVRPDGVVAYLVATATSAPNEYVLRAVTRHGIAVEGPASFVAALEFASANVKYLADASDTRTLRAVSTGDRIVRVAGAAPEGLASGELFAVRVAAAHTRDINSVRLQLSEINDQSGASLRSVLVVLPHMTWSAR